MATYMHVDVYVHNIINVHLLGVLTFVYMHACMYLCIIICWLFICVYFAYKVAMYGYYVSNYYLTNAYN